MAVVDAATHDVLLALRRQLKEAGIYEGSGAGAERGVQCVAPRAVAPGARGAAAAAAAAGGVDDSDLLDDSYVAGHGDDGEGEEDEEEEDDDDDDLNERYATDKK